MHGDSATGAVAITPHNTNKIPATQRIRVGTGGTLKVQLIDGSVVAYPSVLSGQVVKVRAVVVWDTGTSATGMVAEY
jgi:hypothetical protein